MNFFNSDPDHIEVLESKTTSNSTTEVYSFNGKIFIFIIHNFMSDFLHDKIN